MSWTSDIFESSLEEPPKKKRLNSRTSAHKESSVEQPAKKPARKQRMLKKAEKDKLISKLKVLDPQEIAIATLADTSKEMPMLNAQLQEFCSAVNSHELCFFVEHLRDTFVALYKECSTIKERYLHFQIKWQQYCSYFLVTNNSELSNLGLLPQDPAAEKVVKTRALLHQLWLKHKLNKSDGKTFLILLCSSVFNEFLIQCHSVIQPENEVCDLDSEIESDDVYYRFGGAAIASLLHGRYENIKTCTLQQKDQVSKEITLLQKLSIHDKDKKGYLPEYLKYRDEGHMYFPCQELLPFLKTLDSRVKEITNYNNFTKEGCSLLSGSLEKVENDDGTLKKLFMEAVQVKLPELQDTSLVYPVFRELVRKLTHTRVQEYLDSFKHKAIAEKGSASLSGQNLRDSLLSHHVALKTKQ